ncbi:MAG: hypothetical protein MAG451_00252 [Anaerolineales bacterium]|nr:hypothetical protein [Anaerolineales bacterium]
MAQTETVELICPQCEQAFTAEVWRVLDLGRDPALRERFLQGEINVARCPLAGGLWGYTLLCQAAVAAGETGADQVSAIPPGPRDSTLSAVTPHGQLWLLDTPRGNGAEARTIYAIFGPAAGEEALAQDWTWAPQGQLLALELALHRAQSQRRQCQAVAPAVEQTVKSLWATTHRLLIDPEGVTAAGGEEAELQALAEQYGRLNVAVSDLRSLRRTLTIQTSNAGQAAAKLDLAAAPPIQHQLALLRETAAQAEQHIGYAEETLEAAQSALDLVGARFEEREARAQERRNLIVAFLGLILAAGEFVTDAVAQSFLAWVAVPLEWLPAGPYTSSHVFAARLALAVAIGVAGMLIVWGVGKLRRRHLHRRVAHSSTSSQIERGN